jgi:hypothetical protein
MFFAAALTLSLQLQRASFDVLDAVNIEVVAHNSGKAPLTATFPSPVEYEIDLMRGSDVVWTTLRPQPPGSHIPPHERTLRPGPSVLSVFVWNGLACDGTAPSPGEYTLRARMLTSGSQAETTLPVRFINAVPVAAVEKLKQGDEVTIAGTLDAGKNRLTDQTGTVLLMRKLPAASQTIVAVRGYLTTAPDHATGFFVERWAPMSQSFSTPMSTPSPRVRRH